LHLFHSEVIRQQAYWFIGKSCMRLAAGGAPVNKCKNLPVCIYIYSGYKIYFPLYSSSGSSISSLKFHILSYNTKIFLMGTMFIIWFI
jgi:hypothetical protein